MRTNPFQLSSILFLLSTLAIALPLRAQTQVDVVPSALELSSYQPAQAFSLRQLLAEGSHSKPLRMSDGLTVTIEDPEVAELFQSVEAGAPEGVWKVREIGRAHV